MPSSDQTLSSIAEALDAIEDEAKGPELGPILSGLKAVSRYVQLNPNYNGIGINGNVLIDDFIARTEKRLREDAMDQPTYPGLGVSDGTTS